MAPAIFVCDELLHSTSQLSFTECIASLNSDSKCFATVVAVKRGVGGGPFARRTSLPRKDTWHSSWFEANLVIKTPL